MRKETDKRDKESELDVDRVCTGHGKMLTLVMQLCRRGSIALFSPDNDSLRILTSVSVQKGQSQADDQCFESYNSFSSYLFPQLSQELTIKVTKTKMYKIRNITACEYWMGTWPFAYLFVHFTAEVTL